MEKWWQNHGRSRGVWSASKGVHSSTSTGVKDPDPQTPKKIRRTEAQANWCFFRGSWCWQAKIHDKNLPICWGGAEKEVSFKFQNTKNWEEERKTCYMSQTRSDEMIDVNYPQQKKKNLASPCRCGSLSFWHQVEAQLDAWRRRVLGGRRNLRCRRRRDFSARRNCIYILYLHIITYLHMYIYQYPYMLYIAV